MRGLTSRIMPLRAKRLRGKREEGCPPMSGRVHVVSVHLSRQVIDASNRWLAC